MRQTVLGVYDNYADACSAQRALGDAGVAQADITVYSMSASAPLEKGPRVYAPGSGSVRQQKPVFDQLEQLFGRLFPPGEYPQDAEDYREFIRRGGTIVSADVSEMQVEMARDVMRRAGATDIEETANAWRHRAGEADVPDYTTHRGSSTVRESSVRHGALTGEQGGERSDPPGMESTPVLRNRDVATDADAAPSLSKTYEPAVSRDASPVSRASTSFREVPLTRATEAQDAAFSSVDPKIVSGMQQVRTRTEEPVSGLSMERRQQQTSEVPEAGGARKSADVAAGLEPRAAYPSDDATSATPAQRSSPSGIAADPLMGISHNDDPYDDDFRKDFNDHYANTGGSYDEYRRAYTHGATLGQDERYRAQEWNAIEPGVREHWESHYPESGWERFKAAVRHGWERVTGN